MSKPLQERRTRSSPWAVALWAGLVVVSSVGCGSRSGLRAPDATPADVPIVDDLADVADGSDAWDAEDAADVLDAPDVFDVTDVFDAADAVDALDVIDTMDAVDVVDAVDAVDAVDRVDVVDACVPADDRCGPSEICGNGLDDNCGGGVDEGCSCEPGRVQRCFAGPPGRRNIGACRDGEQTCEMRGAWGPCQGGIVPREDICNGSDNLCNGCSQQRDCPILCPSPGDPRVRDATPFDRYALNGGEFYMGPARAWSWVVRGGPCDAVSRMPSFTLENATSRDATFIPRLSGDYTVTLTVVTGSGARLGCTWVVHVAGPGLRVEMCYPENETLDLDLYLHRPNDMTPWQHPGVTSHFPISFASCGWHNCEATIRGTEPGGMMMVRADWGYGPSPLSECDTGPQGAQWRRLGFCANPRLDIDNNLSEGTGLPENINVDRPRDNESFRIMVLNFSGPIARPLVNVYCAGRRMATFGSPPDIVPMFTGRSGNDGIGAMWRVADVRVRVNAAGATTGCDVTQVHPPGTTSGYDVTYENSRF